LEVRAEEVDKRDAGNFGGDDGTGEVLAVERSGLMAEEVKGADVLTGYHDGQGEDCANLLSEHNRAESGPATVVRVDEVDDEDGRSLVDGVHARAFANGELDFVEPAGRLAAAAEGSYRRAVKDQGDGCGVDVEQVDADRAQTIGGFSPTVAVDRREQLLLDRHV
jgi:hypothetical protein